MISLTCCVTLTGDSPFEVGSLAAEWRGNPLAVPVHPYVVLLRPVRPSFPLPEECPLAVADAYCPSRSLAYQVVTSCSAIFFDAQDMNGDMVRLVVRCFASLDEKILSVERTYIGVFDRKNCSSGDISMEPWFMESEFDPCTEMGRLRWNQLMRLLRCRMKLPTCRLAQIRNMKARWPQHLQGAEDVDRFLSDDE